MSQTKKVQKSHQVDFRTRCKKAWGRDKYLHLLALPGIIYMAIFSYAPMYGIQIAFKRYIENKGILGSPWIGLDHFERFFSSPDFWELIGNTLTLSAYGLVAGFPFPIIFALLLTHTTSTKFRKVVQTVAYAPHFISVVVMCGMILLFLSPSTGIVNILLNMAGIDPIYFMGEASLFSHIYVWTGIWQSVGWGAIMYIAALSSISPELYEAARMDGASKIHIIRYVDIPGIMPTIITLFILNMGSFMDVGFQKAFLLQNPLNTSTSEIISTYVYKMGFYNGQFDYSTAVGLFNNIINIILIVTANKICRKISENSLW